MGKDTNALEKSARTAQRELERMERWFALGGSGTPDPAALNALRTKLARAQTDLAAAQPPAPIALEPVRPALTRSDVPMGGDTTGIEATIGLRMDRLATSMAHLYALRGHPLVSIEVKNLRPRKARVAVHCHIEGYSAQAVDSTEIGIGSSHTFHLFRRCSPSGCARSPSCARPRCACTSTTSMARSS